MSYDCIKPGQVWLDTEGNRIQAHGGSVIYDKGTFYWYGENKERYDATAGIWHWGVKFYSSKDLYNWKDEGIIIPPDEEDETSPIHPKQQMDRPHILYNGRTQKYVCWLKIAGTGGKQTEAVLTADNILGPYTMVHRALRPLGMYAGDFDLVADPHDGKAYYYFERVHNEMICADLTDDYTNVTGYYSTHFPLVAPPAVREAPAHFFRNGKHYLFTSGTTGYFPNPSEVAVADSYHGPFKVLGDPHREDTSRTSFNSQIGCVFKHPNKKDLYIVMADRWVPRLAEMGGKEAFESGKIYEKLAAATAALYAGGPSQENGGAGSMNAMANLVNPSIADYVWLPVHFEENGTPYLVWSDEWRIEDFE